MTGAPLDIAKKQARAEARSRLAVFDADARADASRVIALRLTEWWEAQRAGLRTVMVYLTAGPTLSVPAPAGCRWHPDEPDLSEFMDHLRQMGAVVTAPRVDWDAGTMQAVELTFAGERKPVVEVRRHGVPEPIVGGAGGVPAARVYNAAEVDAVLVPGVAFDASGGRVGRGAGFYDRWLASGGFGRGQAGSGDRRQRTAIGVAFDVQVLREVPRGPNDVLMDAVVTERRWMGG